MKISFKNSILVFIVLVISGCGVQKTWYSKRNEGWKNKNVISDSSKLSHVVYLLGDAGLPLLGDEQDPTLKLLQRKILQDSLSDKLPLDKRTLVLLGDNIYEYGLPPKDDDSREEAEQSIVEQLKIVDGTPVRKIVIPGNHDWHKMKEDGWDYVIRQQLFVDNYYNDSSVFQPKGGCPGPVEIELDDNTVIIAMDSEWWLFPHDRPEGTSTYCDVEDESELLIRLRNMVERNKDRHILLVFHHPLISNGNHGGHYSLKDHIFPLTLINDKRYIPLPVIGSIYPLMRKYGISQEDIPNPKYQQFINGVNSILKEANYTIVATGHDHNLQYHQTEDYNHIISGAGSKQNYVVRRKNASFIAREKGFSVLKYYGNGEVWAEFWSPDKDNEDGELLFRTPVYAIPPHENKEVAEVEIDNYQDSTIVLSAGKEYKSHFFVTNLFMGKAYREEWGAGVTFPYLDMQTFKGGLTPIKMGGGQQTLSLRCMGGDGNQYTLRSVNKDIVKILPEGLQNTFANGIIQDGVSSAHPYGALVIPRLADAIDVYHTHPHIMYVPFTPSLGEYIDEFGGMLALVEIRPDENLSEFERFGKSENVVGTDRMLEQLKEDNDNQADQETFLRARTLDVLIGDWDRHEDQWRWAEFDRDTINGEIYRPVPRDRDQAFTIFPGLFTALTTTPLISKHITNFGYKIQDFKGLMESGGNLDRRLLVDLNREEWNAQVKRVQESITDEIIDSAVHDMPQEVYSMSGEEIKSKLIRRRNDLHKYMDDYYLQLAKKVDVVLTDKNEYVNIERMPNGDLQVTSYKRDLDPEDIEIEQQTFNRLFKYDETKEVSIYCLDGEDSVVISGASQKGVLLRVITGKGDDYLRDESKVKGSSKKNKVYDYVSTFETNRFVTSKETKVDTTDSEFRYRYAYSDPVEDKGKVLLSINADKDLGATVGAGFERTTYGFQDYPYRSRFKFAAYHSFGTNAFRFNLAVDYPTLFSPSVGLSVGGDIYGPNYVRNYFGQSNESQFDDESESIVPYRIGLNLYQAQLQMTKRVLGRIVLKLGPVAEYARAYELGALTTVNAPEGTTLAEDENYIYTGLRGDLNMNFTDNDIRPLRGLRWNSSLSFMNSVNANAGNYGKIQSAATFYVTPNFPFQLTMLLRLGAEANVGDFPFYQAATIGGNSNLRGHRMQRFSGSSALWQNLEMRLKLGDFSAYVLKGKVGLYGFLDNGRVFVPDEDSDKWHRGYGGGAWVDLFNLFVLSGSVAFSSEGHYYRINSGFFF